VLKIRGTRRQIALTISANTADYNVASQAGSPTTPVDVVLTINTGVIVGSTSATVGAVFITGLPATSTVTIINNGSIYGKGGTGGSGDGMLNTGYFIEGSNAQAGGPAITSDIALVIDNTNGQIFGGGGGGGGGQSVGTPAGSPPYTAAVAGGGGGGGRGYNSPAGGGAGDDQLTANHGSAGTAGSTSASGAGGSGGAGGLYGGAGGAGGDWGILGSSGEATSIAGTGSSLSPGGAAGFAVNTSSAGLTWLGGNNGTQVKGFAG